MRESDIRPAVLRDEYLRLQAKDAKTYFPDREALVHRPCPACESGVKIDEFEKDGFPFARCGDCGTLYATAVPTEETLLEFYRDSPSQQYWAQVFFPAVAEARREKIFRPRVIRIKELLASEGVEPAVITDVGAGAGMFLEECRAANFGKKFLAIEPNKDLASTCRDKGFDTFEGFAADAAVDPLWKGVADLVVSFEVIEHVLSMEGFVKEMALLAKPSGLILLTGLCGTGFDILTLGERSNAISAPHHLNFISREGVRALLARSGLKEVAFLTPGKLDVDIVANAFNDNPDVITDGFVRHLVSQASDEQRDAFQDYLARNGLSSHMWIVARRPAA